MLTTIALGVTMPYLVSIASAVVAVCVPVLMAWTKKHLSLSQSTMLNNLISGAVARGAGLALAELNRVSTINPKIDIKNACVAKGVQYVLDSFPDAIKALGITPEHIGEMVQAELEKLLNVKAVVT